MLRPGATLTAAELRDYCAGRMARSIVLEHVHVLESLPRTATGKVAKAEPKNAHGGTPAPL
ncbi:MAG: hypothetical protein OXM56_07570 [Gammaproteobacteria bacterium]|nr:hypothetical protein [Gammaproteobacteria bacterium]